MLPVEQFQVHEREHTLSVLLSMVRKLDSGKQEGPLRGGKDDLEDCRCFREEVLHFKNPDNQVGAQLCP